MERVQQLPPFSAWPPPGLRDRTGVPLVVPVACAFTNEGTRNAVGRGRMSREEALEVLGLKPDVSFDRIMSTKNKLADRQKDPEKLVKVGVCPQDLERDQAPPALGCGHPYPVPGRKRGSAWSAASTFARRGSAGPAWSFHSQLHSGETALSTIMYVFRASGMPAATA